MYFLYRTLDGVISRPVRIGQPDARTVGKEVDCGIGRGIRWENVDLFYAPDDVFPAGFIEDATNRRYYVKDGEVEEVSSWEPPAEEEWL